MVACWQGGMAGGTVASLHVGTRTRQTAVNSGAVQSSALSDLAKAQFIAGPLHISVDGCQDRSRPVRAPSLADLQEIVPYSASGWANSFQTCRRSWGILRWADSGSQLPSSFPQASRERFANRSWRPGQHPPRPGRRRSVTSLAGYRPGIPCWVSALQSCRRLERRDKKLLWFYQGRTGPKVVTSFPLATQWNLQCRCRSQSDSAIRQKVGCFS
jgi:hypothetical protein